ncbi:MAG: permease-like cell division protein FtsX [Candidatus Symbiothrix sp.]|nr:permease-like cell division protein FtsX [Candidatus Symbiothrix sp.]
MSNELKENFSLHIVFQEHTSIEKINALRNRLDKTSFVKSTEFISKAEAIKQLEKDLGENMEEFIGFNPLPDLLRVHLKSGYTHTDSLAVIENKIKGFSTNIEEIEYRKEMMQTVNDNLHKIEIIILCLAVVLLLISFALINNTIRLMIYSKRFLIHTMKLVGAKSGFIRKPFIRSNILSGIAASIIAEGLLVWLLFYTFRIVNYSGPTPVFELLATFCVILCAGILISVLATNMAVNKYIRMDNNELYYI